MSKLNILNHALVNAQLSKLRQASTTAKEFREVIALPINYARHQHDLNDDARECMLSA